MNYRLEGKNLECDRDCAPYYQLLSLVRNSKAIHHVLIMEIAFLYATIDERHFTKMKHLLLTFLWIVTQVVVLESYHVSPKYVKFVSKPLTRLDGIKNPWRQLDIKNSAIVRSLKANPLVNIVSRIYSYFWWLPRKNLPFEGPSKLFSNSTEEFLAYRQVPRNLPPIRYIADGLPDDFFCYGLPGNTLPYGNWDPCGFSQVPENVVRKFRESELKHGRLAMLATIGCLLQETWHPLYSSIGGMAVTHMAQFQTLPLQDNHLYQLLTPLSPVLKDLLDRYQIPLDFYTMFYFMMALESFFFVRNWSRWKRNEYDHQFIGNIGIGNLKPVSYLDTIQISN